MGDVGIVLPTALLHLFDETLATLRVGVATVHETMHEHLVFEAVFLAYLDEFEEMVQRRMHATRRGESHQVEFLAFLLGIAVGCHHLFVLQNGTVFAGAVDLHEILIHHSAGTDIEVAHLRVAHLAVWQADIFARSAQLRMSRNCCQIIQKRCRRTVYHVTLAMLADSPSVENHQKSFFCHN